MLVEATSYCQQLARNGTCWLKWLPTANNRLRMGYAGLYDSLLQNQTKNRICWAVCLTMANIRPRTGYAGMCVLPLQTHGSEQNILGYASYHCKHLRTGHAGIYVLPLQTHVWEQNQYRAMCITISLANIQLRTGHAGPCVLPLQTPGLEQNMLGYASCHCKHLA